MDLIVTTCRALANRARLKLIRAIHAKPGSTVNALAETVGLSPDSTSHHLKLLSGLRLVQPVPNGRYVRYRPTKTSHITNTFLREIQQLLRDTLPAPQHSTPDQVWNASRQKETESQLLNIFTTYTHLRRLLILRHMSNQGGSVPVALAELIGMSPAATHRHLDKLQRRGVVCSVDAARTTWLLAAAVEPELRQRLLNIVLHAMRKPTL